MRVNTPLAEMFGYNRWANTILIEACRALTDDQLDARIPSVSGSVRELLTHIVGGQQTFALRTQARQHEGELNRASPWPGWDTLTDLATHSNDDLIAIAEGLDKDADVGLPHAGKMYRYPKSFFLVHAIEHGVEHRTEIKVALAQLGVASPDLDAWEYAAAVGYGTEVRPSPL